MSYRDNHDAALARADAASHDARVLSAENARLETELAQAREWLGGPRKSALVLGAGVAIAAAFLVIGIGIGRTTASSGSSEQLASPPPPPLPQVFGVIVSQGPELGDWALSATRCVSRTDGIELTQQGGEEHNIWLTNSAVEVEGPGASLPLKHAHCMKKLARSVVTHDTKPPTFDGYVDLDCRFNGNRLVGRIEFRNCR